MKVLVIGGAGYIGSHVVKCLDAAGHEPWVMDDLSTGRRENILFPDRFLPGDVLKDSDLKKVFSQSWDAVIHLAALKNAGESMEKPGKYSVHNISGSINILDVMQAHNVQCIVFSSSAAVYGNPVRTPIDENHPTEPVNFYGFTKLEIEKIMDWYSQLCGLRFASLRYFNAAGYESDGSITGLENNPANLLPVIMEVAAAKRPELRIFGNDYDTFDGTGIRDYVHVSDLARAHVMALEHIHATQQNITVNLGSGKGISVLEMVRSTEKITGRTIPFSFQTRRKGDPALLIASAQRAKELLGWETRESDVDSLVSSSWKVYEMMQKNERSS